MHHDQCFMRYKVRRLLRAWLEGKEEGRAVYPGRTQKLATDALACMQAHATHAARCNSMLAADIHHGLNEWAEHCQYCQGGQVVAKGTRLAKHARVAPAKTAVTGAYDLLYLLASTTMDHPVEMPPHALRSTDSTGPFTIGRQCQISSSSSSRQAP
jgi:hypothetical protein